MSPESRTLIIILLFAGALASCCLCVPVVALIAVPAIARVHMAAEQAQAKQQAERRALERSRQRRPPLIVPPRPSPPPSPLPPIAELEPPVSHQPPFNAPGKRRMGPDKNPPQGLAALSEFQRRSIYRSATVHEKIESSMKQQIADRRQRGFDPAPLERMLKDRQSRQSVDLDRLRDMYQLSREEFEQILAEGREKNW